VTKRSTQREESRAPGRRIKERKTTASKEIVGRYRRLDRKKKKTRREALRSVSGSAMLENEGRSSSGTSKNTDLRKKTGNGSGTEKKKREDADRSRSFLRGPIGTDRRPCKGAI